MFGWAAWFSWDRFVFLMGDNECRFSVSLHTILLYCCLPQQPLLLPRSIYTHARTHTHTTLCSPFAAFLCLQAGEQFQSQKSRMRIVNATFKQVRLWGWANISPAKQTFSLSSAERVSKTPCLVMLHYFKNVFSSEKIGNQVFLALWLQTDT